MIQPNDPRVIENTSLIKERSIKDKGLGYLKNLTKEQINEIYSGTDLDIDIDKLEEEGKIRFVEGKLEIITD